jgi:microcystin-dependent protein
MDFILGQVVPFAGNFAPKGWMLCNGQLLPISQYTALFSLLGVNYGGNGTTNFALPDLRGAVAISPGQGPGRSMYSIGEIGGSESVTITSNEMPTHTHSIAGTLTINVSPNRGNSTDPTTALLAEPPEPVYAADVDSATVMNPGSVTVSLQVGAAGGTQPFPTMMPYLAVNYCICIEGIFPQRP